MTDQGPELPREPVGEALDIIQDSILETEITPDNALSFGTRFLDYTIKDCEHAQQADPTPVLGKFITFLEESLQAAREGDPTDLSRFLRSQRDNVYRTGLQDPQHIRQNEFGQKLGQIADALTPQSPANPA